LRRLLWFLAGVGLCVPASGQSAPRIEVSPTIGYLWGGELWSSDEFHLSVGDHLDYGVRAGWMADPHWEFEFDWTRVQTKLVFQTPVPRAPVPLDIDYVGPRVVYHFCTGTFRPYIASGLGAAIFNDESGTNSYFTGTLAVGLKAFVTPNLGARIEARGFGSGVGDPPLGFPCTTVSGDPAETTSCGHEWILNGDVTAGLVVAF
jgi:hypothetical protein